MELVLTGLDGKNPLAFLAALGALNILAEHSGKTPKLFWRNLGVYRPVLVDGPEQDALLDVLARDPSELTTEPAFDLHYAKANGNPAHDLKPPMECAERYLLEIVRSKSSRSAGLAASFLTDVVRDGSGTNAKPTALHFTAGQQEFLVMIEELRKGVTRDDFEEALFGPWRYARPLPVLQWDNSQTRDYALRATDPSKDKKLGVPGADWLAMRGLAFLPVSPVMRRNEPSIATTGCQGSWKGGTFRWPMWSDPLDVSTIRSLLTSRELFEVERQVLRGRGIPVVFESSIARSDQGGYGSFSPAGVAERRELGR